MQNPVKNSVNSRKKKTTTAFRLTTCCDNVFTGFFFYFYWVVYGFRPLFHLPPIRQEQIGGSFRRSRRPFSFFFFYNFFFHFWGFSFLFLGVDFLLIFQIFPFFFHPPPTHTQKKPSLLHLPKNGNRYKNSVKLSKTQ